MALSPGHLLSVFTSSRASGASFFKFSFRFLKEFCFR